MSYSKCRCGHAACDQYFMDEARNEGRVPLETARLWDSAREMLGVLEEVVSGPRISPDLWDRIKAVVAKAKGGA